MKSFLPWGAALLLLSAGLFYWIGNAFPLNFPASDVIAFRGDHQAGVTTPSQEFALVAVFDLTTTDREGLKTLLKTWTEAADKLSHGQPLTSASSHSNLPPDDTGETRGLSPARLTLTFGVGPSLFDGRFGLAGKRPSALVDLPSFRGDRLEAQQTGGDLCVQACADDLQTVHHAIRNLTRVAKGLATVKWVQQGFLPLKPSVNASGFVRNLQGFKDGTVNPETNDVALMQKTVWASSEDGAAWMKDGTYLVVRKIRMFIEVWDRSSLSDQEKTIGRSRETGSPLGSTDPKASLDLAGKTPEGDLKIPEDSHVRLAHGDGKQSILRRGFSYANGLDPRTGQWDSGLLFLGFQRDPRVQFIPIQTRLAEADALSEYIAAVGSGVFAILPGISEGGWLGQSLVP